MRSSSGETNKSKTSRVEARGTRKIPWGLFPGDRKGIRFRLSTLLLLSTLNAVALAAGATVLFRAILVGPTPSDATVRAAMDAINRVQNSLLLMAVQAPAEQPATTPPPGEVLNQVLENLAALGKPSNLVRKHLVAYARVVDEWMAYMANHRTVPPSPTPAQGDLGMGGGEPGPVHHYPDSSNRGEESATDVIETLGEGLEAASILRLDDSGELLLARLNRRYRRLLGELAILATQVRPPWIDMVVPWVPWVMGYVVAFGLLTMGMAFRLRSVLSVPLENLRVAAGAVAAGRMEQQLAAPRAATEIRELAQSMEAMRARLVDLITSLDARTNELTCILNSLSDGVLVLDEQNRLTEVNPRAVEILGGRVGPGVAPMRGVPLEKVLPELEGRSVDSMQGEDWEVVLQLEGGKKRYVVVRAEPVRRESAGEIVVVLRDVSKEHELEQMKRDFLSVVTHELKTPLTSIEGYSRLLLMGKGGRLSDIQREFVQTIVDQSLVLKEMVQNLLDITRIEGQNLPINPKPVDPFEEVRTAANSIRGSVQSRGLTLETEIEAAPGTLIHVDPFRLQQILGNLLSNALKFTDRGGTLTLKAGREGDVVRITVADTGRGIPSDAIPRLFDKFYQVAQGDTRLAGGAGLGLYICKQLAEAQGGTIEVTSRLGEGSAFTVTFPVLESGSGLGEQSPEAEGEVG